MQSLSYALLTVCSSFFDPYSMNILMGCSLGMEMESSDLMKYPSNPFKISVPLFVLQGASQLLIQMLQDGDGFWLHSSVSLSFRVFSSVAASAGNVGFLPFSSGFF